MWFNYNEILEPMPRLLLQYQPSRSFAPMRPAQPQCFRSAWSESQEKKERGYRQNLWDIVELPEKSCHAGYVARSDFGRAVDTLRDAVMIGAPIAFVWLLPLGCSAESRNNEVQSNLIHILWWGLHLWFQIFICSVDVYSCSLNHYHQLSNF